MLYSLPPFLTHISAGIAIGCILVNGVCLCMFGPLMYVFLLLAQFFVDNSVVVVVGGVNFVIRLCIHIARNVWFLG